MFKNSRASDLGNITDTAFHWCWGSFITHVLCCLRRCLLVGQNFAFIPSWFGKSISCFRFSQDPGSHQLRSSAQLQSLESTQIGILIFLFYLKHWNINKKNIHIFDIIKWHEYVKPLDNPLFTNKCFKWLCIVENIKNIFLFLPVLEIIGLTYTSSKI